MRSVWGARRRAGALTLTTGKRGLASVVGGTAAGQLLALASVPIISRLYTPSEFGVLAVITAMGISLGSVAGLRLELAIPLPRRDRDAVGILRIALASSFLVGGLGLAIVIIFGDSIAVAFNQAPVAKLILAVPLVAVALSCGLALNQWAIRQHRFAAVGRRTILQNGIMVLTQLVGGIFGTGSTGLVAGVGLGYASGAVGMLHRSGLRRRDLSGHTLRELRTLIRSYWRFPVLLAPAYLLNVLGLQLPVLLVSSFFDGQTAGWLGMTQRVLAVPVTLIGTAVGQVYLGHVARAVRDNLGLARNLFGRATRGLCWVAIPFAASLLMAGPWLFTTVLGSQWAESGQFARALALGVAAQLVASPLSQTLIVLERVVWQFWLDVGRATSVVVGIWASISLGGSALTAMWVISIMNVIGYASMWLLSRRALELSSSHWANQDDVV